MPQEESIRLEFIRREGVASRTQVRETTRPDTVQEYATLVHANRKFPPVELLEDGKGRYFICDGWHRVEAHIKARRQVVKAHVLECHAGMSALDSAVRHALGSNRTHGLKLSSGDQGKKAETALLMPSMQRMADRKIEKEIGVSHQVIGRRRAELVRQYRIPHPLTGEKFDEFCPPEYAAQDQFNGAFNDVDDFKAVHCYVRKLTAFEPANWKVIRACDLLCEIGQDGESDVILHRGLIRGKGVVFVPFDNPIVKGLPQHYEEVISPIETAKVPHGTPAQWLRGAAIAAENRLKKRCGSKVSVLLRDTVELLANPVTRADGLIALEYQLQAANVTIIDGILCEDTACF